MLLSVLSSITLERILQSQLKDHADWIQWDTRKCTLTKTDNSLKSKTEWKEEYPSKLLEILPETNLTNPTWDFRRWFPHK